MLHSATCRDLFILQSHIPSTLQSKISNPLLPAVSNMINTRKLDWPLVHLEKTNKVQMFARPFLAKMGETVNTTQLVRQWTQHNWWDSEHNTTGGTVNTTQWVRQWTQHTDWDSEHNTMSETVNTTQWVRQWTQHNEWDSEHNTMIWDSEHNTMGETVNTTQWVRQWTQHNDWDSEHNTGVDLHQVPKDPLYHRREGPRTFFDHNLSEDLNGTHLQITTNISCNQTKQTVFI